MYQITKARWLDTNHTQMVLDVSEIASDPEGNITTLRKFGYIAAENDTAPLNTELWAQVMQNPEAILEDETTLILTGQKPLPEGYTIIGERIYNDAEQAALMQTKAQEALAKLTAPEAIARAELDEEYASERREKMRGLLAVDQQPGYPYNVDWSGLLP